jgi:hypothetical protein
MFTTEGVWSHLKRGLGNCAATGIDQLVTLVKTLWGARSRSWVADQR